MVIIPITRSINWKNPPVATIGLVLLNIFVFFTFQLDDGAEYSRARAFYFESGLALIEVTHFVEHLEQTEPSLSLPSKPLTQKQIEKYCLKMQDDSKFMAALSDGRVIKHADAEYDKWRKLKNTYEGMMAEITSMRFGYRPASPSVTGLFTHMFLHGGIGHLVGNMIFLWIVGCILEIGCGRMLYLASYLVSGVVAALVFGFIDAGLQPLIGASGAISGLMGMLSVLYGKKRVNVFYSLGFYFDYITIRAIVLLPLWIGNELIQLYFGSGGNIAYMAHVGGLVAGGICAVILLKIPNAVSHDIFEPPKENSVQKQIEEALECMSKLDLEKSLAILESVLAKEPGSRIALRHLFTVLQQHPDSRKIHARAGELILEYLSDPASREFALYVYEQYRRCADSVRLPPQVLVRIGLAYCRQSDGVDHAARIFMAVYKRAPGTSGMPALLIALSDRYKKMGNQEKHTRCQKMLLSRYPASMEADRVRQSLPPA